MAESTPKGNSLLLDPEFIKRIEQLTYVTQRRLVGRMKGERRSKRKGVSIEFADYRNYVAGDDIRFIDWNTFGRLDKLFLKLFVEEEDLHLYILLDVSASMDYGEPEKALYAKKVAAALAYIGLAKGDRVVVGMFDDGLRDRYGPARGKRAIWPLLDVLEQTKPGGRTSFTTSFKDFFLRHRRPGIAILISDFFEKKGLDDALKVLLASRSDLYALHLLAPQEISPESELKGDLKLIDAEDGDETEVTISAPLLKQYQKTLLEFRAHVKDRCTSRGIRYLSSTTDVPFDRLILEVIRKRGLLR